MNELFKTVLSLSLAGSAPILLLLLIKPLLRGRVGKRWQYYIWLVVILRLLLPFGAKGSPMDTLFQQSGRLPVVQTAPSPSQTPAPQPQGPAVSGTGGAQTAAPFPAVLRRAGTALRPVTQYLWLVWLMVALLLLLRKITIYQSFARYLKAGNTAVADPALLDRLALLGEQAGVTRPMELCVNGLISSPLLIGFFRPRIVLPTAALSEADFAYTVLHELTHYRRRDMFYKWLVQLTLCLHWFNPLVHVMAREIGRACELACDESVVRTLDGDKRRAYGDTLLHAVGAGGGYRDSLSSVTLGESGALLKERLEAIMSYRKPSKAAGALALALTLALGVGATAIGAYAAAPAGHTTPAPGGSAVAGMQIGSGLLPDGAPSPPIDLDIYSGGVELLPAAENEITASYDSAYYDVRMTERDGRWSVSVSGKVAKMGETDFVQLHVPGAKRELNVSVLYGDFRYDLPENPADSISVTAADSGIQISSPNGFQNSEISLTATEKEYTRYDMLEYPNYFTKTETGFAYRNGTEENRLWISLTGYTGVEFTERTDGANA